MAALALDHRITNTVGAPLRAGGEIVNGIANIPRQGFSALKNTKEVQIQTWNALVDNFLNFSKVEGKRYQRLAKGTINLASAVTRRPLSIALAGAASTLNQGVRQPFKKLLYTPGKMFKGLRNSLGKIFSAKKGYEFQTYETHETSGDTWINKFKEQRVGFFGKGGSSKPESSEKEEKKEKKEEKSVEKKEEKSVEKKEETPTEKKSDKPAEKKDEKPAEKKDEEKSKSIPEIEKKRKEEAEAKDEAEKNGKKRKNIGRKDQEKIRKEITEKLGNNLTEEGVIARGKKYGKGDTIDEIMKKVEKEDITSATFIEDEILAKNAPQKAAA